MAVSDLIRDIRKRNGMSQSAFGKLLGVSNSTISEWESDNRGVPIDAIDQIVKTLNVSVHYLMDWAEDADALAPANALSPEALHVARVYDTLDAPGMNCLRGLQTTRPHVLRPRNQMSSKLPGRQSTRRARLTLLRQNNRNQQDNFRAGLSIQILVYDLGARIIGRADVRQYGQVDWLAACNVSHVLNLLSGYTILYACAGCNMQRLDILSHIKSRKWEGGRNP